MRYLTVSEVLWLHKAIVESSGGAGGVRDLGALESALAQPKAGFGGQELYPSLVEKAAALLYSLVLNHPFLDGNKRVGHAAMEIFLLLSGHELFGTVDEQEELILSLAAGNISRPELSRWIGGHLRPRESGPAV